MAFLNGFLASPGLHWKALVYSASGFNPWRGWIKSTMPPEEARRLAEFIHDHDKRFEANAKTDGPESIVQLTRVSDGTELEPVTSIDQYRQEQIETDNPGPTVRAAWEKWGL